MQPFSQWVYARFEKKALRTLIGPQILSLERSDYFETSEYFDGWKKEESLRAKLAC